MEADHPSPELLSEIIFSHILPRLPVKPLMRFRCVSKSWSSLIRSPFFVDAYRNFHGSNKNRSSTNFLFRSAGDFFSFGIDQQGHPTCIANLLHPETSYWSTKVQSIKGLVCVSSCYGMEPVFIFNPSIDKEYIKLPNPTHPNTESRYHFGFSPLTNEYKVLRIILFSDKGLEFSIFTLGKDSWRPLQVDHGDIACDFDNFETSVCVHGGIHCMHETKNRPITVFDVGDETFRSIPLPEDYAEVFDDHDDYEPMYSRSTTASIVEVRGCVAVFVDMSLKQSEMVLWILMDYHNHVWVKEIIAFKWTERLSWREWYIDALGTIHTGELALVFYLYGHSPGYDDWAPQLHLYDMKTKRYREFDFPFPKWADRIDNIIKLVASYEDSIVLLNEMARIRS